MSRKAAAVATAPTSDSPDPLAAVPAMTDGALLDVRLVPVLAIGIEPSGNDRRGDFAAGVRELAASMGVSGLKQPIGVVELSAGDKSKRFGLVYGYRRLAAAQLLGWREISAVVLPAGTNIDDARLVENIQREELTTVELAIAVAKRYGNDARDVPDERKLADVAFRVGKSIEWVRSFVYLARLDADTIKLVEAGRLPLTHAKEVAKLADPRLRAEIAKEAAAPDVESLPMELDELRVRVKERLLSLAVVPWRLDQALPGVKAPACRDCPSNTANDLQLFDPKKLPRKGDQYIKMDGHSPGRINEDLAQGPFCMNAGCYREKTKVAGKTIATTATKALATLVREELSNSPTVLESEGLVPAGIVTDALVSEVRSVRRAKQLKAEGKSGGSTAAGKSAAPSGKKYLDNWEVDDLVRNAIEDAKDAQRKELGTLVIARLEADPIWEVNFLVLLQLDAWYDNASRGNKPMNTTARELLKLATGSSIDGTIQLLRRGKLNTNDFSSDTVAMEIVRWMRGDGYWCGGPQVQKALRDAFGISSPLPEIDEKAIRATVIEDLVMKKKIAPPPGYKGPRPGDEKAAAKTAHTAPKGKGSKGGKAVAA